jgi:hypothetical protein
MPYLIEEIEARLNYLRQRWKTLRIMEELYKGIGVFALSITLFSIMEAGIWASVIGRILFWAVIFGIAGLFFGKALYFALSITFFRRRPDDIVIADWVGRASEEVRDRLRNALQLFRLLSDDKQRYSRGLIEASLTEVADDFMKLDLKGILSEAHLKRSLRTCLICLITLLLLLVPSFRSGAFRLFHPFESFSKPLPFSLKVVPGDTTVVAGDSLKLTAKAIGGCPDDITFLLYHGFSIPSKPEERIIPSDKDSTFSLLLANLTEDMEYRAVSGRVRSALNRIEVLQPPAIRRLNVKLIPPAYSGLAPRQLEDNIGDILALAGSEAQFRVKMRGDIASAIIVRKKENSDIDTINLNVRGDEAVCDFRIFSSGVYHIELRDREDLSSRNPIEYKIDLLPDLPPTVDIVQPGEDLELMGIGDLNLLIEAEDDFAISELTIFHHRTSSFTSDTSAEFERTPLPFRQDVDGVFRAEFLWSLSELDLIPGDMVEYYAFVFDNDNVMGPKAGRSKTYILRLPSMNEMFSAMEEAESDAVQELEKALTASQKIKEEVSKAIDEMKRKGELDWSQKRDLQEKTQNYQEVMQKLQEAETALQEIVERAEQSSLLALELAKKYQELQKLLSEIATPEMREAFQKLNEALQQADPEALRQALDKFQLSQEEMLKQIEKTLEILQELKLERQLEELAKTAEELSQRQKDIAENIPQSPDSNISDEIRQEQDLRNETNLWAEKLEEAVKTAQDCDSTTAQGLSEISEEASQIPGEMEKMTSQMQSNQRPSAGEKGKSISRKLSEMSKKLSEMKESLVSRKKEELAQALLTLAGDLVAISQAQEELKIESQVLSPQSPGFRRQSTTQSAIAEGLENVTERLFALSKKSFFITPEIGNSLGEAGNMMKSALDNYTARNPRGVSPQQGKAMESINRATVQILDAVAQMEQSSSPTGYAELMEKLSEMASQQSNINQGSQSMMPMPGEGGMMAFDKMSAMGRLAAEQRALQQAMQEAAEQAQALGGVMGDLGQIADQMGQSADSLEDRNVGERTLRLQERILSRMLDAQKSVRTQRTSKERESRTGQDFTRRSPADIPQDELEEQLRRDILRALKEGYSPDYQKLIQEYFKALRKLKTENR